MLNGRNAVCSGWKIPAKCEGNAGEHGKMEHRETFHIFTGVLPWKAYLWACACAYLTLILSRLLWSYFLSFWVYQSEKRTETAAFQKLLNQCILFLFANCSIAWTTVDFQYTPNLDPKSLWSVFVILCLYWSMLQECTLRTSPGQP